nr:RNA-directed DNA polymerase, eukaryota, reverse transcriptase zinc-binding domain protein [Tanacetum cinerariifolium]
MIPGFIFNYVVKLLPQDSSGMLSLLSTLEQSLKSGKKHALHAMSVTNVYVGLLSGLNAILTLRAQPLGMEILNAVQGIFQSILAEGGISESQCRASLDGFGLLARLRNDIFTVRLAMQRFHVDYCRIVYKFYFPRFFSQKNSLWVRVVKALHGEDGKLMGNGVNTSFWDVAWCGDIAFKNLVPRLYELEYMKNIEVASKLSPEGLEFSFRRNPRGGVEEAQFERLKEIVEGVTLSNSNDRWSWSLVGSGDFSVSSVRKLIDNAILPKGISKTRWIKEVPIKINVHT